MSDAARTYLEQVFNIMKTRSIKRLTIIWDAFHSNIFNTASNAQTISGVYPAIREALSMLADGHSSYTPPAGAGATIFVPTRTCRSSGAPNPSISAPVGYVRIGAFSGTTTEAIAFANMIQGIIANGDRDDLVGWIVDLRGNGGGNMWPMVAGVGPILGDGVVGNFIDPTGAVSSWEYRAGASILSGTPVVRVETPYRLRRASPKVAVLLDNGVASSGEAVAIAFRQRPNTRSFGSATCGLSTANSSFTLSDGAVLNLTVAVMADRTRTTYGDQVPPDEPTGDPNDTVQRAIAWLRSP
jgi:C-terminal processing protease CtpA/Prc